MINFVGIILGITGYSQEYFRIIGHSRAKWKNKRYLLDIKVSGKQWHEKWINLRKGKDDFQWPFYLYHYNLHKVYHQIGMFVSKYFKSCSLFHSDCQSLHFCSLLQWHWQGQWVMISASTGCGLNFTHSYTKMLLFPPLLNRLYSKPCFGCCIYIL